jgi:two-component system CheB/CheR fusion protein
MPEPARAKHIVVALGASAGGLDAFKSFFANTPPDTGMAFVVIQHLATQHKSLLVELLGAHTQMPVKAAEDGMAVERDHVFVIPPDAILTIADGHLRLVRPAPPRERRWPVNVFFVSLAEERGECAVAVILSGAGTDGTIGLKSIKEHGGFTLAQSRLDATAMQGMPHSAAAAGLIDFVMPAEDMPARILQYQQHLREVDGQKDEDGTRNDVLSHLPQVTALLRARLGHDFSQYKERTLVRRIQRRMQLLGIKDAPDYHNLLRRDKQEQVVLFHELLINVTEFFRDAASFEALEKVVVPQLLSRSTPDEPVRIWVPGCATGEEALSIAILLKEAMVSQEIVRKVQIFATDLDDQAITSARHGRYPRSIAAHISGERLERWFVEEGDDFCPRKLIREMCIFSKHDITNDPPFSRLDLISCRNLFIYLNTQAQSRLLQVFHYALRDGGFLFLGSAEGVMRKTKLFETIDKKHRIFQRSSGPSVLPTAPARAKNADAPATPLPPSLPEAFDRVERNVLLQIAPPAVLIDGRDEIVRYFGLTGRYLGPSPGAPDLNLYHVLRSELRAPARALIQKARAENVQATQRHLILDDNGTRQMVTLIAAPVSRTPAASAGSVVLILRDEGQAPSDKAEGDQGGARRTVQLEEELRGLRLQLNSTISELEVANEELKSSNEEYQSVNEELQSTNEELETAKEELQSTNEELQTINVELANKNDELTRSNSDLRNFLDSTDIGTLFLDGQLRIKTFTPAMTDLLHLRDGDRGRPVTDLVMTLAYDDLEADVRRVMRTLSSAEREVEFRGQRPGTFMLRIRPYRTIDNVIEGVVLTFVDVTARKQAEAASAQLGRIVEESRHEIYVCDYDSLKFSYVNRGARENLGYSMEELENLTPVKIKPEFSLTAYRDLVALLGSGQRDVITFETFHRRKDGSRYPVEVRLSHVTDPPSLVANVIDISERRLLARELAHRSKNMLAIIQAMARQTARQGISAEEFERDFSLRLAALSASQDVLMRGDWRGAVLADVVGAQLGPYEGRVEAVGPDLKLKPDAAHYVGMALHELATNAAKYGALSTDEGNVSITWQAVSMGGGDPRIQLSWVERGGPPVKPPTHRGFGQMLVKMLAASTLDGTAKFDFVPTGVQWSLEFPAVHLLDDGRGE